MGRKLGKSIKKVNKAKLNHVFIATPAYDGKVDTAYCQSITDAVYACPLFGVKVTLSCLANGAFIELARNQFVKTFLEEQKDCTHLFFIDADLSFPPDAFVGLINLDWPIVAGVYPKREPTESYPVQWAEHEDGGLWAGDEGFLMANRVPTGFLCIRRDVLEEMAEDAEKLTITGTEGTVPWVFGTSIIDTKDGGKTLIGEDFYFCDRYVEKYGKPIPVYCDIDFVHGKYKGNIAEWLNRNINPEKSDMSAA